MVCLEDDLLAHDSVRDQALVEASLPVALLLEIRLCVLEMTYRMT